MTVVLVSDGSALTTLDRDGALLDALGLPAVLAVSDLFFKRHLGLRGATLVARGLRVITLDAYQVALASGYRNRRRAISLCDSFALALAKTGPHTLLTGYGPLCDLAHEEAVECRPPAWVVDWARGVANLGRLA